MSNELNNESPTQQSSRVDDRKCPNRKRMEISIKLHKPPTDFACSHKQSAYGAIISDFGVFYFPLFRQLTSLIKLRRLFILIFAHFFRSLRNCGHRRTGNKSCVVNGGRHLTRSRVTSARWVRALLRHLQFPNVRENHLCLNHKFVRITFLLFSPVRFHLCSPFAQRTPLALALVQINSKINIGREQAERRFKWN